MDILGWCTQCILQIGQTAFQAQRVMPNRVADFRKIRQEAVTSGACRQVGFKAFAALMHQLGIPGVAVQLAIQIGGNKFGVILAGWSVLAAFSESGKHIPGEIRYLRANAIG